MRHRLAFLSLFLAATCAGGPALADTRFTPLQTKIGVSDLRSTCSKVQGSFDVSPDGKGYSCTKQNCDGKGGNCTVACDNNNNCTGATPARLVGPTTLIGLLQNGDRVLRGLSTGGTGSPSGDSDDDGGSQPPAPAQPPADDTPFLY